MQIEHYYRLKTLGKITTAIAQELTEKYNLLICDDVINYLYKRTGIRYFKREKMAEITSIYREVIKYRLEVHIALLRLLREGLELEEIIDLTNKIASLIQKNIEGYRNKFGGKMKVGYSSPSYISGAVDFKASLDGRKDNEPFNVHISSKSTSSYTELIQFASKLDYSGNKFNGNVIDFMVSKDFIENNFDKFVDLIMLGIKNGFFQMQVNVLSSKILIEAKENPEKYPNLIVRVWGFSAYFKDLPEAYKNLLIERALESEGNC